MRFRLKVLAGGVAAVAVIAPGATQGLRFYGPFGECAGDHPDVSPVRAVLGSL